MNKHIKGVLSIIVAAFIFTSGNALFKQMDQSLPPTEVVFFRNFLSFFPYVIFLFLRGEIHTLKITNYGQHVFRGAICVLSFSCFFHSLTLLPLADTMTLSYMVSIFAVLLSPLLLKEQISSVTWIAVSLGFAGIMFVAGPQEGTINMGVLCGLVSAFCEALLMVHGRNLTHKNSNAAIIIYCGLFASLISALTLPFVWVTPSLYSLWILTVMSVTSTFGQYLFVEAYRLAPITLLSPFIYTSLIWSVLYDVILFGEIPSVTLYIGVSLIITAGFIVLRQENTSRKKSA